ncbi:hypothetical protein [Methylomagnum ishizawai]|uniref:hypothetical protein n=1 Tax=Methylomagnum ishizawai TaxID=1760988 RepID=UPI001C327200|nr:hypothetical protein [Methylomagnum ishizawai]BBL75570.1 hypothetical protein MishRS11D_26680 [Methylomagnum ishizawai]
MLAAMWAGRALSDTDLTALCANPWQLLAPRTIIVPVAGGGGGGGVALSGSATCEAMASAVLSVGVALSGSATCEATASATLSVDAPLAGSASCEATATAALSVGVPLSGSAACESTATASLTVRDLITPPPPQPITEYLVEITGYKPGSTIVLRLSTSGYTTGASDDPPHTHYEARLLQPGLMRRDVFSDKTTGGKSTVGFGIVEAINTGDLDYLMDYAFDGRQIRILAGYGDKPLSEFTTVFVGTMEQAEYSLTRITWRIRDRMAELAVPVQTVKYAGNNARTVEISGTAVADWKDGLTWTLNHDLISVGGVRYDGDAVSGYSVDLDSGDIALPASTFDVRADYIGPASSANLTGTCDGTAKFAFARLDAYGGAYAQSLSNIEIASTTAAATTDLTGCSVTIAHPLPLAVEFLMYNRYDSPEDASAYWLSASHVSGSTYRCALNFSGQYVAAVRVGGVALTDLVITVPPGMDPAQTDVDLDDLTGLAVTADVVRFQATADEAMSHVSGLTWGKSSGTLLDFTAVRLDGASVAFTEDTGSRRVTLTHQPGGEVHVDYVALDADLSGLEGTDDIKGNLKPKLWGHALNVSPPLANASRLIYQVNDGPATAYPVWDDGVAITRGADYASQADMEATAPAAGTYRAWPGGGCFRLGSSPQGQVTCDAVQGDTSDRTAAQILKALALRADTLSSGDIVDEDITAMDADNSAELGIWLSDASNIDAAMDAIANSVGAWYGFDRLGRLRMGILTAPSGTPDLELSATDITSLELSSNNDSGRGIPYYQIAMNYGKNYTVQSNMDPDSTNYRKAWAALEYRTYTGTNNSTKTVHPLAGVLTVDGLFVDQADAGTEAGRRLALYGTRRDTLTVSAHASLAELLSVDLMDVVKITYPRFGYGDGKLFRVLGLQPDYRTGNIELTLWG